MNFYIICGRSDRRTESTRFFFDGRSWSTRTATNASWARSTLPPGIVIIRPVPVRLRRPCRHDWWQAAEEFTRNATASGWPASHAKRLEYGETDASQGFIHRVKHEVRDDHLPLSQIAASRLRHHRLRLPGVARPKTCRVRARARVWQQSATSTAMADRGPRRITQRPIWSPNHRCTPSFAIRQTASLLVFRGGRTELEYRAPSTPGQAEIVPP